MSRVVLVWGFFAAKTVVVAEFWWFLMLSCFGFCGLLVGCGVWLLVTINLHRCWFETLLISVVLMFVVLLEMLDCLLWAASSCFLLLAGLLCLLLLLSWRCCECCSLLTLLYNAIYWFASDFMRVAAHCCSVGWFGFHLSYVLEALHCVVLIAGCYVLFLWLSMMVWKQCAAELLLVCAAQWLTDAFTLKWLPAF